MRSSPQPLIAPSHPCEPLGEICAARFARLRSATFASQPQFLYTQDPTIPRASAARAVGPGYGVQRLAAIRQLRSHPKDARLRFGPDMINATLQHHIDTLLNSPDSVVVPPRSATCGARGDSAGGDTFDLRAQLQAPINFPSLAQAVVPGDTIVIGVCQPIPGLAGVLLELLDYLNEHGIESENISLLLPNAELVDASGEGNSQQWDTLMGRIRICYQDIDQPDEFAFLGPNQAGLPVYVNRRLFDADFVIPLMRRDQWVDQIQHRPEGSPKTRSTQTRLTDFNCGGGLVPVFCTTDRSAVEGTPDAAEGLGLESLNTLNVLDENELQDQLGVFFTCEAVVGPGSVLRSLVVGERTAVRQETEEQLRAAWNVCIDSNAPAPDLIAATIEAAGADQCWTSVCLALINANRINPDGPIVILSDAIGNPPRELKKAVESLLAGKPQRSQSLFSLAGQVIESQPVYMSGASRAALEPLGIGVIESAAELQRLCDKANRLLVLQDGHRCRIEFASSPQTSTI